ncbi:MAG: glycosyltransferase [Bacteroidetes bacterium QS_3_64_15]|nr:MAG: glycosyltransferase [Bacteroidetes bacterium QS_3_64_15]
MEQTRLQHSAADAERPDVSIIVPAYEEAESLPELADELRAACEEAGLSFRVWIVDDGSRDDTWRVVQRLHEKDPRVAGLRFRRNYGKSAALSMGFNRAQGRYVATIDADLQDDPSEIPRLIDTLEEGYDLVSGWKKDRKDPLSKTIPSRFFNWVPRHFSGLPLHDFNCGLKVYRREVVKNINVYGELHRYIPLLAKWEGYDRVTEQEGQHHPRKYGTTKFGTERFIQGFLDLITVVFLTRYAVRPMHFFGSMGTVAFVVGLGINLWLSIEKLIFGNPIGGARPLLLLGLLLILFGSQMFTTGLLGEMIIRPRMEDPSTYEVADAVGPVDESAKEVPASVEE